MLHYNLDDWTHDPRVAEVRDDEGNAVAIRNLLGPQEDGAAYEVATTYGSETDRWRVTGPICCGDDEVRENLCQRYMQLRLDHDPVSVPDDATLTVIGWIQPREPGDHAIHQAEDKPLPYGEAVDYLYMRAAEWYKPIERSDDPFANLLYDYCSGMGPEEQIARQDQFNPYGARIVASGHVMHVTIKSGGTAWIRPDACRSRRTLEFEGVELRADRGRLAKAAFMLSTVDAAAAFGGVTVPTRRCAHAVAENWGTSVWEMEAK